MSFQRSHPHAIGRYEIVRELGSGAMGRVLLARDPVLERHVAIKILRDDLNIAPNVREALVVRMRHEARAAARVTHPNLVVLHDMGEDPDLGLYLVFEYLKGPTLKQALQDLKTLKPRRVARLAAEIGSALSFAHERGVLHRDVKPENIILTEVGAKLADFGIARVPDSTLTHTGGLLGTPAYSAPETFREARFSPKSDQFSLASTLYEALAGARAFPGDDALSVAHRIANEDPKPFAAARGLDPEVDAVMLRALSKRPEERFDTCDAFGTELVTALRKPSGLSKPVASQSQEDSPNTDDKASGLPPLPSNIPALLSPTPDDALKRGWLYAAIAFGGLVLSLIAVRLLLHPRDAALESAASEPVASAASTGTASAKRRQAPRVRPDIPLSAATASGATPVPPGSAVPSASATPLGAGSADAGTPSAPVP